MSGLSVGSKLHHKHSDCCKQDDMDHAFFVKKNL
jgi:hypothetical protein